MIKICIGIIIALIAGLFIISHQIESWVVRNAIQFKKTQLEDTLLQLNFTSIEPEQGYFLTPAISINQITISTPKGNIPLGSFIVHIPFTWPFSIHIQNKSKNNAVKIDANIYSKSIQLKNLSGIIDSLLFKASGHLDFNKKDGAINIQTIGLGSFSDEIGLNHNSILESIILQNQLQFLSLHFKEGEIILEKNNTEKDQ